MTNAQRKQAKAVTASAGPAPEGMQNPNLGLQPAHESGNLALAVQELTKAVLLLRETVTQAALAFRTGSATLRPVEWREETPRARSEDPAERGEHSEPPAPEPDPKAEARAEPAPNRPVEQKPGATLAQARAAMLAYVQKKGPSAALAVLKTQFNVPKVSDLTTAEQYAAVVAAFDLSPKGKS